MSRLISLDTELIRRELSYWKIPGMAVAVVREGESPVTAGFGWRDLEGAEKVDENTKFGIASCSKSMTAALVAAMCGEGRLDYDTPVTQYAPDLLMMDTEARAHMTLRDMMSHRTGLPPHDALWPGGATRRELAGRLQYLQPSQPFRGKAQYNNLMYAMVGYVAECAGGKPWDRLMREYLFHPLGMDRTGCFTEELASDDNHAEPYRMEGSQVTRIPIWNVDLAGPAASVYSTASDMAKWLAFQLRGGRTETGAVLIPDVFFRQMHEGITEGLDSSGMGEEFFPCPKYGLGWCVGEYRGRRLQKHTGKIEGYSSIQAYLPDEGLGVAVLLNFHSPTVSALYTTLYSVLDQALGLPAEDWAGKFHSQREPSEEEYRDCHLDLFENAVFPEQSGGPKHRREEYVGSYENPGYGTLGITETDHVLYMDYRDMHLPITHVQGEVFRAEGVKEDIWTMAIPLIFTEDGDGTATGVKGVKVRFEPQVDDILFRRIK